MSRIGFIAEKLIEISKENSDSNVQVIFGSGAPGGDTGEQDDSPIGSLYIRLDDFNIYNKLADAGAAADWFTYGSLYSISGTSQGDVDMGAFTGGILTDSSNIKALLQEMSDFIEKNIAEDDSLDGVTTQQTLDDELVDEILAGTWEVSISLADDESRRRVMLISIAHDGTPAADATSVDDTVYAVRKFGANFNWTLSTALSGAAAAQVFQINVASTETNGINVRSRKLSQVSA